LIIQNEYPLVICYIAIEHGDLQWIFPLKIVIFHSYVSLPEGNQVLNEPFNPCPIHGLLSFKARGWKISQQVADFPSHV